MKALLKKYDKLKLVSQELVELPDDYDGDPYGDKVPFVMASNWALVPLDDDEDASQYRYPKYLHTFPKDQFKNPDGPLTAWVYNDITDPVEPYANYIIEVLRNGQFMLVLENDSFITADLGSLEARLFEWMEGEGVTPYKGLS
jgi:hypothetical protein